MQEKIEDVPGARVVAVRPDLVLRNIVLVGVSWRAVGLEACSLTQGKELLSYDVRLRLKSTDPFEVCTFPPGSQ